MFIIGLTGGIGSGKSTAANILQEMGLKIIDLDQIAQKDGVTAKKIKPAALKKLQDYPWTGNIRELRNVIERLMILGDNPITKQNIEQFASK